MRTDCWCQDRQVHTVNESFVCNISVWLAPCQANHSSRNTTDGWSISAWAKAAAAAAITGSLIGTVETVFWSGNTRLPSIVVGVHNGRRSLTRTRRFCSHQCTKHLQCSVTKLRHQKQHYVPYYLSIVLILSIKDVFGIISMFFTLVRCSIVLLMFLLTYCIHVSYLMSKFIAFLNIFSCPTRNVPYGKTCLLWNLGLSHFFFRIVLYSLQVHNVRLQMFEMSLSFFSFLSNLSCINHLTKSFLSSFSTFFLILPIT